MSLSNEKLEILKKIKEYEANGEWDKDVEKDPISKTLYPDEVDYMCKKLSTKIKRFVANSIAYSYYEKLIKKGKLIIKEIKGKENFLSVKGGAFITCNHFSVMDNYAIYRAVRKNLRKKRLYKVIKEGNYTSFKGLYAMFFKYCNTLPLSSNFETMKKFFGATEKLLARGEKILIYPEQSMWWNYRKPRPLKSGAFKFAKKFNAPIIPAFICMEDTDKLDDDGAPIQAYTICFSKPIYPDKSVNEMMQENYDDWKTVYEQFYGIELKY